MNEHERWVKSGLLGQGIDAHYDITRVTDTSHGPVIAQVLTSHVTEEARRTASQRADLICSIPELINRAETAEARATELAAQLATAQARIAELTESIEAMRNNVAEIDRNRFERMAPLDWRESEQETPYGQMLDGLGDEVES